MKKHRRIKPLWFVLGASFCFGFGLLASLQKDTEASHSGYCEKFIAPSTTYEAGAGAPNCATGPVSYDKSLWCLAGNDLVAISNPDTSGFLTVKSVSATAPSFRTPIPVDLMPNPLREDILATAIAAGDFNNDGFVDLIGTASDVVDDALSDHAEPSRYVVPIVNDTQANLGSVSWNQATSVATPKFEPCIDSPKNPLCMRGFLNGGHYRPAQGTLPDLTKGGATAVVAGHFDRGPGQSSSNLDVLVVRTRECSEETFGDAACLYNQKSCVFRVYLGAMSTDGINGALDVTQADNGMAFQLQETPPQPMPGDNPSCDSDVVVNCNEFGEIDWTSGSMIAVDWPNQTTGATDGVDDIIMVRSQETNPVPILLRNITTAGSLAVKFQVETLVGLTGTPWSCPGGADDEYCTRGLSAVAVTNFNADAFPDLIYGRLDSKTITIRRQTALGVWESAQTLDAYGPPSFLLAGDLDGGAIDVLAGLDNWNLPAASPGAGCDVSRAPLSCADAQTGGRTELWSSKDTSLTELGWTLPCAGGVCAAATNFGRLSNVTCHADGAPYTDPGTQGASWVCSGGADEATHGKSREGIEEATPTDSDNPTPAVIYDWDTAVLMNYDGDYNCAGALAANNPGYRSSANLGTATNDQPAGTIGGGHTPADTCFSNGDPFQSLDLVVADGNDSQRLWVIPNRSTNISYEACSATGTNNWTNWSPAMVPSGTDVKKQIVSACISVTTDTVGSGSNAGMHIKYELSNDGGRTGVLAQPLMQNFNECPNGTSCFCAAFPTRENAFQWRARLCPNNTGTKAPTLSAVSVSARIAAPVWDTRSAIVVADGMRYVAQHKAPGNKGRLLAYQLGPEASGDELAWVVDDGWDYVSAVAKPPTGLPGQSASTIIQRLPADASRKIYTTTLTDVTCSATPVTMVNTTPMLRELTYANAGVDEIRFALGNGTTCASTNDARSIINYIRCGRWSTSALTVAQCTGRFAEDPCLADTDDDRDTDASDANTITANIGTVGGMTSQWDLDRDGWVTATDAAIATTERAGSTCRSRNMSRLGGFYRGTPAVLTAPRPPYWQGLPTSNAEEVEAMNDLTGDLSSRPNLVIAPAGDGMLHAFFTDPLNPANPDNGKEVWAFVPQSILQQVQSFRLWRDAYSTREFVDGSPRLYDYYDTATGTTDGIAPEPGSFRTALVFGDGSGGNGFRALDITETVDPTTHGCVTSCTHGTPCNTSTCGLRLLWQRTAGDANTMAMAQPALVRLNPDPLASEGDPAGYYVALASGVPRTAGDAAASPVVNLVRLGTGTLASGWPITQAFPARQPTGRRGYIATPVAVDTRDENGAYSASGDGNHDAILLGDTDGFFWRLPAVVPGPATIVPHNSTGAGYTAPVTMVQGAADGWAMLPTAGSGTTPDSPGAQVQSFKEGLTDQPKFNAVQPQDPNSQAMSNQQQRIYGSVIITDTGCFFSAAVPSYVVGDGAACAASEGGIFQYDCINNTGSVVKVDGGGALEGAAIVTPLFGRAGVITFATQHGDIGTFGTGNGSMHVSNTTGAGGINWWREVW